MADDAPSPVESETDSSAGVRDGRTIGDAQAAGMSTPDLSSLDDAALVELAKHEPEAFGALYERHVRAVFAFAFSKVHDSTLAEDLTSQTFLQALRALPRYEQRGAPIRSWLFRIAGNLVADRHRAPHLEVPLQQRADDGEERQTIEPPDPNAEADITAWERADAFARLIEELTPEQRTVVRLRFVDGLPLAAIAERTSRSEGAVKMLLLRALQNLRRTVTLETADAR